MRRVWRRRRDPTFSVLISTLDRCESLRRTLDGLARQTYQTAFEAVVVNGPSTDGTAELLAGYPVRVGSCTERNVGLARNVGARMAAGEVIAVIDDDAVPEPDWLEQLAGAYDDPTVAAAGGPVFDVPLGRIDWAICTSTREGSVNTQSEPPADRYVGPGCDPFLYFAGCNLSVRRSAMRMAGGFNPALPYCYEDVELCMRLIDAGARLVWVEEALVHHHRAASWLRDAEQVITDPYGLMFSRAVFAVQCSPTDVTDVLAAWLAAWCDGPAELVPEDRRAWFRERAGRGIEDGVRAGHAGRPQVGLGRPQRREFRPYA